MSLLFNPTICAPCPPQQGGLVDALLLAFKFADSNLVPTDTFSIALTFPDNLAAQTETFSLSIKGFADTNAVPSDSLISLGIKTGDTNTVPTDASTFVLKLDLAETNAAPTETTQLSIKGLADTNVVPTETRLLVIRSWASGSTTNDVTLNNTVAPTKEDGQPDSVFTNCTTSSVVGDTTNPVTVTTGSMNYGSSTTSIVSARIRLWATIAPIGIAVADVASITATASGGYSNVLVTSPPLLTVGWGGFSSPNGEISFDVSTLTSAQLNSLVITSSLTAGIILTPQTSIKIDAIALEVTTTL